MTTWQPPARDGVSPSRLVVTAGPSTRMVDFLAGRLRPGIDWAARMAEGGVLGESGQIMTPDAPCRTGQAIWYWRDLPPEPRVPFELVVLHRDDHLVVIDKPHFLAAIPGGRYLQETALVRLRRLIGDDALMPLHRLDRETAGVMMFSARSDSRNAYHALLRERRVHKVYEAVAPWRSDLTLPFIARHRLEDPPEARHLPVRVVEGEPNTQVTIELIRLSTERDGDRVRSQEAATDIDRKLALYRLTPITGRRHQLRAQMAALGIPIVGDRMYPRLWPDPPPDAPPDYTHPLQLLAREVAFDDPLSGLPRRFVSLRTLARAD